MITWQALIMRTRHPRISREGERERERTDTNGKFREGTQRFAQGAKSDSEPAEATGGSDRGDWELARWPRA